MEGFAKISYSVCRLVETNLAEMNAEELGKLEEDLCSALKWATSRKVRSDFPTRVLSSHLPCACKVKSVTILAVE